MAKDKSKKDQKNTKPAKSGKADKASKKGAAFDEFTDPTDAGQFNAADLDGKLLLIKPTALEEDIATSNGPADAVRAEVVVLTTKKGKALDEPEVIADALIFQKVIKSVLTPQIGKMRVLGTLFSDEASKKPGQSAPWKLAPATDAEKVIAKAYLAKSSPFA